MSDFSRAALEPVAGTPAAQAQALLALPVLTWLYPPADFNLLVIYVAMLRREAIFDNEIAVHAISDCAEYTIGVGVRTSVQETLKVARVPLSTTACRSTTNLRTPMLARRSPLMGVLPKVSPACWRLHSSSLQLTEKQWVYPADLSTRRI